MSPRRVSNYVAISEAIAAIFLTPPLVAKVVIEFEKAIWLIFGQIFPWVQLCGCFLQFFQEILCKAQMLQLHTFYRKHFLTKMYVRKLMAWCYLPADPHILIYSFAWNTSNRCFAQNHTAAIGPLFCQKLAIHLEASDWNVFGQPIKTNNDVKGWQNKLNKKLGLKSCFIRRFH